MSQAPLARWPSIVAHVCGDPLSRYTCRATSVAADFLRILGFFRCSSSIALHPPKKALSHLSPLNCQECRTSSCLWKGVALQGGVAATLVGVALHCATKWPRARQFLATLRRHMACKNSGTLLLLGRLLMAPKHSLYGCHKRISLGLNFTGTQLLHVRLTGTDALKIQHWSCRLCLRYARWHRTAAHTIQRDNVAKSLSNL